GEFKKPLCLGQDGVSLYQHGPVEAIPLQDTRQQVGQEGLPQHRGLGRHPGIFKTAQIPEMLVSVNSHLSWLKFGPALMTLTRMLRNSTGVPLEYACRPIWPNSSRSARGRSCAF